MSCKENCGRPVIVLNMAYDDIKGQMAHFTYDFYAGAVWEAGGLPVLCPVIEDKAIVDYFERLADGVLFIGGKDYLPEMYGCATHPATDTSRLRGSFDLEFAQRVLAGNKPFLGICGGCQLVAIATGGTLLQHLPNANERHRDGKLHQATVVAEGDFSSIMGLEVGAEVQVNSIHHQAVDEAALPSEWRVTARAFDGTVEVIERSGAEYLSMGVQFHPERGTRPCWQCIERLVADARRLATAREA